MPQLIPTPWLALLIFSWTIFSTIVLPKMLKHSFPDNPTPRSKQDLHKNKWDWSWH
uniref:ATP synthase complex subunit 8 n=1 Tax=Poecilia hondurensis TaxID=1277675 RepID=L7S6T4_9TELE|nr:ATP synthase 8 [Poecilia hondurensis]AGC13261.1 ATP synthase 8 [Poecilia hondurensis]AGC13265.1 ATP synthase 8 [Poecilia hondurensis]